MNTTTLTITRDGEDLELDVDFHRAPIIEASIGDPGDPAEGGEITSIIAYSGNKPVTLSAAEEDQIVEWIVGRCLF